MLSRKGFTLVELMVVILIVAILAAVAIPIMRGRIDEAKWSEGKAIMGTIATALRTYVAGTHQDMDLSLLTLANLGFEAGDLTGTYFVDANFSWIGSYTRDTNILTYTITATAPTGITSPDQVQLIYDRSTTPATRWVETTL